MKIGFFTDTYHPQINGVVENVDTLAKALRKRGHKVYIFAPKIAGYTDKDKFVVRLNSVRIIKNPEQRLAVPLPTKAFRDMLRMDLDIIHAHGGGTVTLLGYQLAVVKGLPFIVTYHTLFTQYVHYIFKGKVVTPKMVKSASRVFCNLTDLVIAPSKKIEKELLRYGVTKPIAVVPGGINMDFYQHPGRGYLRNRFGLKETDRILLFTGRLGKEKNLRFLIQAFKSIALNHKNSYLVIVGDGPERKNLETMAINADLKERILFTGFVLKEELPQVYADGDIFVFASKTETQGLVVAEALASGLPVVAVEDEAIGEMVTNELNGYLSKNNPKDFAQLVLRVLDNDSIRGNMAKAAKKEIKEKFTSDRQAETIEVLYKNSQADQKKHPRSVTKLTKRISSVYNYLNTATVVTVWKSLVRKL